MGQQLKARVGAKGIAFASKHTRGVFPFALKSKCAGRIGVAAGYVVQHEPLQYLSMVLKLGQGHLADGGAREAFGGECGADFFVPNLDHVFIARIGLLHLGPLG